MSGDIARSAVQAWILGLGLPLALAGAACTEEPPAPLQHVEFLGPVTIGGELAEIQNLAYPDDCPERHYDDCEFTDPATGVTYDFADDGVWQATITEEAAKPGVKLPLGLTFSDSLATALAKVQTGGRTWTVDDFKDPEGLGLLISKDRYAGENGWDFTVLIHFKDHRLDAVYYFAETAED
jgi:hypothetical protein